MVAQILLGSPKLKIRVGLVWYIGLVDYLKEFVPPSS